MFQRTKIKLNRTDRVFTFMNYFFLTLCMLAVLYPLIYVVSSSLSSANAVMSGRVWLFPVEPSLMSYKAVFNNSQVVSGYLNTILYTVAGTGLGVILTVMAAYPLSRKDFYGRSIFMGFFTFTMLFSGGMIPGYLLINKLGLINSRWAMIIPGAMGVYYVIIARTFFMTTIPDEIYEAAILDGCGDIRFIWSIVLPLSGAIIAVLVLFYAVNHWNSYMAALLYLRDIKKYPLQLILRNILIMNQMDMRMLEDIDRANQAQLMEALLKYSLIVVGSAPILALYPFIQKFFVKGVMIGSLKG